jgi:glycogen(starch) synthase
MRILQIGPYPPPHGGVQTNLKAIYDRLLVNGHDGLVIAVTRRSATEGVPNTYKPRTAIALFRLLISLRYDLVHLHLGGELTTRLAVLMFVCGLLPGKKSVVTFHSGGFAMNKLSAAKPYSLRGIAFRSVDHVIAVNEQMVDMMRRYGVRSSRLSLIPPFVARRPAPGAVLSESVSSFVESRRPLLLSMSLLEPEYAVELQVEAMARILERYPDAGLLIAGSGSLFEQLQELIAAKPYKDRLLLAGDLDHDVTLRIMELADVALRPTHYDGDAVSIREALYLGTPVIATDNGMRPEGVILISLPPDASQLAEAVIRTLDGGPPKFEAPASDGSENINSVLRLYDRLLGGKDAKAA